MLSMIFKGVAGVCFVELPIFDDYDIFHSTVDAPGAVSVSSQHRKVEHHPYPPSLCSGPPGMIIAN